MKNLKLKLMSAIAMLMVATIGLASVSFAWFTISTNPEIKGMKMNIAANENLEIALDNNYATEAKVDEASNNATAGGVQGSTTGNPYTWGNLVDLSYAFAQKGYSATSDRVVSDAIMLKPVKYVGGKDSVAKLQYPQYGNDGRISALNDLTGYFVSDLSSVSVSDANESSITEHNGVTVYAQAATKAADQTLDAVSATYWMRSNMAAKVRLATVGTKRASSSEDSSAATTDVNGVLGEGSYIRIPSANSAANDILYTWLTTGKLSIQFDEVSVTDDKVVKTFYAYPVKKDAVTTKAEKATAADNYYTYYLNGSSTKDSMTALTDDTGIALTANTATKVIMYVYLDGQLIVNKDALLNDLTGLEINIQFAAAGVDDAMDVGAAVAAPTEAPEETSTEE